jgi:hypothetical protein
MMKRAAKLEARLDKDIQDLKNRFLPKQSEEKKQTVTKS